MNGPARIRLIVAITAVGSALFHSLLAAPPLVANVRANQRTGTRLVDIYYNVSDPDSPFLSISVAISADGGTNYNVPAYTFSGDYGAGVAIGLDRHIVWNAGMDWSGQFSSRCKVRIFADDGSGPTAPSGMVLVPAGAFQMGDNFAVDNTALPVHSTFVSAFFMDESAVTKQKWDEVRTWAVTNGYSFVSGSGAGSFHPVQSITWYDAVKWCNARSEMSGLTPVYYTTAAHTILYRTGNLDLAGASVNWGANGFRLPTEAEREKAARGGLTNQHYPWPSGGTNYTNQINGSQANYSGSGDPFEVGHGIVMTTPAGFYSANGYGLNDIAGNVWEWCWDWYSISSYPASGIDNDPHGPTSGSSRVIRGGAWSRGTRDLRCARRSFQTPGASSSNDIGFRCVRGL